MFGFHGSYLRIDLSSGEARNVDLDPQRLRKTLGGVGLGTWLLSQESPSGVDPFAPEAPLVFSFSPLVGTEITTSAKFAVVGKSPLTGLLCDALASSHFAIEGKALGVDAIVVVGACDEPSEWVDGALRPTRSWGASAARTAQALAEHGRVIAIGPAGERRVRYAGLSADGRHAGRGGLGAVMGAKNLKAMVFAGCTPTRVARPDAVAAHAVRLRERARGAATEKYRKTGTVGNLLSFERLGVLPTFNFQQRKLGAVDRLDLAQSEEVPSHRRASCAHCTIGCEHQFGGVSGGRTRLEYESLFALGPLLGIEDPAVVLAAARRCDEVGLDTISVGGTLAFAMECGERGLLSGAPRFSDPDGLISWIDAIASREGLGDRLAEGSKRLAQAIGGEAESFAAHVKGLEIPGYEPRSVQSLALGFAVSTRGADHNRSSAYEADFSEEADRLRGDARSVAGAIESEDRAALLDSMILCKFLRGAFDDLWSESAALLEAVTGFEYDAEELRRVARRIVSLRKAFNIREGWNPDDDTLPDRFLDDALPEGPLSGVRLPRARLESLVRSYNLARGWDDQGYLGAAEQNALRDEGLLSSETRVTGADRERRSS